MKRNYPVLIFVLLLSPHLFAQLPIISSFSPASGSIGTPVVITGTNFSSTAADNIVFFGAVKAAVNNASSNSITVTVPAGATFQPMTVTVNGLTAYSAKPFLVTFALGESAFTSNSFEPVINYSSGSGTSCIAAGDLDLDGKADIISVSAVTNSLIVFRNISSTNISLAAPGYIASGNQSYCVLTGDLDGDGKQDIVMANSGNNTVSLFRNTSNDTGQISFAAKIDLLTGTFPYAAAITDFNGDGKPDIAVVNSSGSSVSIFKNNSSASNFSFSNKADFTTGSSPYWIDAGDLDGDGKPDIATANGVASNSVSVLRNTSTAASISFATKTDFDGGNLAYGISIADLDGDNKKDLIVANGAVATASILLNNSSGSGNISFAAKKSLTTGYFAYSAVPGDMNGDGKVDIIAGNENQYSVSVFKNTSSTGTLSFDTQKSYQVQFGPWVVVPVDLNNDGKLDIATANQNSGYVSVLQKSDLAPPVITSFIPAEAGTGDTININGTNLAKISTVTFGGLQASSFSIESSTMVKAVVGNGSSGYISVSNISGADSMNGFAYNNTPVITSFFPEVAGSGDTILINGKHFISTSSVSFGGTEALSFTVISPFQIKAVIGTGSSGNLSVINSSGTVNKGGFIYIPPPVINNFNPTEAGSLQSVIITGNNFSGATSVSFGDAPAASFIVNSNTSITAIIAGGSSGNIKVSTPGGVSSVDGFIYVSKPLPVINSFSPLSGSVGTTVTITGQNFSTGILNNIVYFGAVKAEVLTANSTLITVKAPSGATYAPVSVTNENGLTAYAVQPFTITYSANVTEFTNNSFASKKDFSVGAYPRNVAIIDLDGDSRSDLAVVNGVSNTVSIFKNISIDSGILMGSKIDSATGDAPIKISTGDLDGDGLIDLIITNTYSGGAARIFIYKNNSNNGVISFAPRIELASGSGSIGTAVGDLDGDGRADIIVTSSNSGVFSIFRNLSFSGHISFSDKIDFVFNRGDDVVVGDMNGDNKPDLILTNVITKKISVYKNTSIAEFISFADKIDFNAGDYPVRMTLGDFNSDGKTDIAVVDYLSNLLSILRNTSANGEISFADTVNYNIMANPINITTGDLDGDGKPDLALGWDVSGVISLLKNTSSSGQISFAKNVDIITGNYSTFPAIGDLNGDGQPDIAVSNSLLNTVSILKNNIGEAKPVALCPPITNTSLSSNITGINYQWQVNTGSGFSDITNNINYANPNTATLQLNNIPSSWYGYKFRCKSDDKYSDVFELRFLNTWTGSLNNLWNNPSNWTCGVVPDSNTDVIINTGTLIINSNVTIGSLKINPGATITVNSGFNLTVLHKNILSN